jgi:hypothetical protein
MTDEEINEMKSKLNLYEQALEEIHDITKDTPELEVYTDIVEKVLNKKEQDNKPKLMTDEVWMKMTRDDTFALFNSLLVREKSLFRKQKEAWSVLLTALWKETADRVKVEVLWKQGFRDLMDSWSIPYQEDIKRLEIPQILEDDEEE